MVKKGGDANDDANAPWTTKMPMIMIIDDVEMVVDDVQTRQVRRDGDTDRRTAEVRRDEDTDRRTDDEEIEMQIAAPNPDRRAIAATTKR